MGRGLGIDLFVREHQPPRRENVGAAYRSAGAAPPETPDMPLGGTGVSECPPCRARLGGGQPFVSRALSGTCPSRAFER